MGCVYGGGVHRQHRPGDSVAAAPDNPALSLPSDSGTSHPVYHTPRSISSLQSVLFLLLLPAVTIYSCEPRYFFNELIKEKFNFILYHKMRTFNYFARRRIQW